MSVAVDTTHETLRVLIVEDQPITARLISSLLAKGEQVRVDHKIVSRLSAAVAALKRTPADLVLLDLNLPDSSGLSTLRRLRRHAPEIPVVVLTADDADQQALQALREGAQDYLIKSAVDERNLLRSLRYASERARTERDLQARQEQLWQAQKMEAIGQLSGSIAHDFNNLLTVILGSAQALHDELGPNTEARADARQILDAGQRGAELTRQLLTFSRKQVGRRDVISIHDAIDDLGTMFGRLLGEQTRVVYDLTDTPVEVEVDRSQLQQVVMNLVVNARDAMPGGGALTIQTGRARFRQRTRLSSGRLARGEYVVLAIEDTGTGIAPELLDRIFEPFFTTKATHAGTGLGLATVFGIIRQARGGIDVKSTPQQGSRFAIYLPAARAAQTPIPPSEQETRKIDGGDEPILLVEDEDAVRRVAAQALTRFGYHVHTYASPGEALRNYSTLAPRPRLLLTDVVMPELNGPELAARLREQEPRLQIIYMSGYPDVDAGSYGQLETHHYLPKPFNPWTLASLVRRVLDFAAADSGVPRAAHGSPDA